MVKSSLIELLKTFSDEEWKSFSLFLQSPYFNRSKSVQQFFTYLSGFRPELDSPKMDKEKAFAAVYGKQVAYAESKFSDLMYKMKGLAEAFLVAIQCSSSYIVGVVWLPAYSLVTASTSSRDVMPSWTLCSPDMRSDLTPSLRACSAISRALPSRRMMRWSSSVIGMTS